MILSLLVQAQVLEHEGDHRLADVLIKTSQIDKRQIPFDSLFKDEEGVWNLISSRYGDNPDAPISHYTIYSGVIALFIRTELQILFEMAMSRGIINRDLSCDELQATIHNLLTKYIQKRAEHGLPHVKESFLKSSIPYAFNVAQGYSVSTPIIEDRRFMDRRTGSLSNIKSIFYQPDIDEESYMTESLSDFWRRDIPED